MVFSTFLLTSGFVVLLVPLPPHFESVNIETAPAGGGGLLTKFRGQTGREGGGVSTQYLPTEL